MRILVNSLAIGLYLLASFLARPRHRPEAPQMAGPLLRDPASLAMLGAWLAHSANFALVLGGLQQPDFGFAPALSLTFWLVAGVYWIESQYYPLQGLRSWICLLAAISLLLTWFFPANQPPPVGAGVLFDLHWAMGIAAYGLFGAAVLHGVMLWSAERALHRRHAARAGLGPALSLLTLEKLTYRLAGLGFIMLTASLVFAILFSARLYHRAFEVDHQTVLALAAWVMLAVLMLGRAFKGWRGRIALRWLFSGSALLLLSYVGSRFVLQVILHR